LLQTGIIFYSSFSGGHSRFFLPQDTSLVNHSWSWKSSFLYFGSVPSGNWRNVHYSTIQCFRQISNRSRGQKYQSWMESLSKRPSSRLNHNCLRFVPMASRFPLRFLNLHSRFALRFPCHLARIDAAAFTQCSALQSLIIPASREIFCG
jgi:hypothetical protein